MKHFKKFIMLLTVVAVIFVSSVSAFAYDYGDNVAENNGVLGDRTEEMDSYREEGYTYFTLIATSLTGQRVMLQTSAPLKQLANKTVVASSACRYVSWTQVYTPATNTYSWREGSKGTLSSGQSYNSSYPLVAWASYDFYDSDGNLVVEGDENFFPQIPLAELVLEVTEGELVTVTIPKVVGILKVLVPCGVGCLALLAVLKLFGKRSLIFRN